MLCLPITSVLETLPGVHCTSCVHWNRFAESADLDESHGTMVITWLKIEILARAIPRWMQVVWSWYINWWATKSRNVAGSTTEVVLKQDLPSRVQTWFWIVCSENTHKICHKCQWSTATYAMPAIEFNFSFQLSTVNWPLGSNTVVSALAIPFLPH